MAEVIMAHGDEFEPMKLSQICLLKLSKDDILTANILEIANYGLPGHLLDDFAILLSANGLCLFESHGILNGNDLDTLWSALCDHNRINRWDLRHKSRVTTTKGDRQKGRSWKEFYFQWQFYELFRNRLNILIAHLARTKFFLFETPELSESEVEICHTRLASLFEENLDFIRIYPRMLRIPKVVFHENRQFLHRITKNVKKVEFCSFVRFKRSYLEAIHDVFTCCAFSKMSTISFRDSKILEDEMSQFKAIMEESCKMEATNDKAVASKEVYPEKNSNCERSQDVKGKGSSLKHAFGYPSYNHETVECNGITAKRESISDRMYEESDDFEADIQNKTRMAKQGDTVSESKGFQGGVQSKKPLAVQEEDASGKDCLAEYFPIKRRKFVKEETVPVAACNNTNSDDKEVSFEAEDRMRTSQVAIPKESIFGEGKFVSALEDMDKDLMLDVESKEIYSGTGDVTFDDALCCGVLESYEHDKVANKSTNQVGGGQSSVHTSSSPNCCSTFETSRLTKLKFFDCILSSSSISVLCDIIQKLPDLRTVSFYSEDTVESIDVDKIVLSMLQLSRKGELFSSHKTQGDAQERVCTIEKIKLRNCNMGLFSSNSRDCLLWHKKGDCHIQSGSKLPKLKSLTLMSCDIFDAFNVSCSCEQRHLVEECLVTQSYCTWTTEGWDWNIPCQFINNESLLEGYLNGGKICTCNWSSLVFLDLSDNDIWCKGAEMLSCVLKTSPVIKVVRLERCKMPTKGCRAIFDMAKDHPSLEQLSVIENDYDVSEDGSLARLISDGRLTHLFLESSITSDSLTEEFFDSFSRNATLKSLDLAENRLGEKEMKWFSNVLSRPETLKSLEELQLRCNRMPVSSLNYLADAMVTSNRRLVKLNVNDCIQLKGEGLSGSFLKILKERVDVFSYMPDIDTRRTDYFDYVSVM